MSKAAKTHYGNDSISALKGADRVRKRPGVIFGSDSVEGCRHAFFEILSNSIDEAREGHGDRIIITKFLDKSLKVQDFGRGIPVDFNTAENEFNWKLVFCELYAGGKYQNDEGENYEYSLGLNGLGLCATQYASEYMDAEIVRDGIKHTLRFEKGEPIGELVKEPTKQKTTGTTIKWRPDLDVFTDIDIDEDYFRTVINRQAVVNAGVTFEFQNETQPGMFEETLYFYKDGISDYVKEILGDNELIGGPVVWQAERRGRDRADKPEYKLKFSTVFAFSNRVKFAEYFHNSSFLEYGGSPEKAVRAALVSRIDTYIKQAGKYLKGESKITFADIEECLVVVSSSFSTRTSYENQTKKSVTNKFIYEAMNEFLRSSFEVYFTENPDEAARICEQILINKRSRENAENTRLNLKKKLSGTIDMANRVQKFIDCRSRDTSEREIYIVEGDSAMGACKLSRDARFQAIIPVRGKILNCLKADFDKIFKNDIITDIIKVLGCGVEVKNKANKELSTFDIENLKWNKVIICTDADVDGFQIRTLILTMLYTLVPTLIEKGFVYIAESPLYEITSKDKTYFAYTEAEKIKALTEIGSAKYTIQRSKGLGENEPDMMWLTTMNPETRRLIKVNSHEVQNAAEMFEMLLGDNLAGRKEHIATYGHNYLDAVDVS